MRRGSVRFGCVSAIESLSAKRRTFFALTLAALTGCELVAGIQNLTYTGPGSPDAGAPGDDATTPQTDSGIDSPVDAASDEYAPGLADATSEGPDGNASWADAPGEMPQEAAADAVATSSEVNSPLDAGGTGATGVDVLQVAADAGAASFVVPIPGPDGGPLPGDGGPLLGELIDDINSETMPGWIPIRDGRVGTWFTYSDGTAGGVAPPAGSAPALIVGAIVGWNGNPNNLAAHVSGNGLAVYAGMGFDLNAYNLVASTYDASAYRGFVFWGRIGGDSGSTSVRFAVPDKNTSAAGGVCTAASEGGASGCSDYFAETIALTPTWKQFVVYYSDLTQSGFGLPKGLTGLDATEIYSCQFQLSPGAPFDVWIDDIYFIDK